jgi:hypothetical protein
MSSSNFYLTRPFTIDEDALVSSNVPEDDYGVWNSGTTYALADRVIVTDDSGSPTLSVHNIYESLQGSNTNHDPVDDDQTAPVWWILVSKTNRWKMFDNSNSSQTQNADSIEVELNITSRPNAVFFGNVEASEIQVIQKDNLGNEVFNQTFTMIENTGSTSYYSWFLSQLRRKVDLFVTGLQPYAGGKVYAVITNTGSTAKCGTMIVGFAENVGFTQLGASVGISDFSVKRQNDFGDFEILERAFNKKGEFNIFVENAAIDRLQNNLASVRATAILYVGSTAYASTFIYGFYRDFNIVITYPEHSLVNIQVEGLT